MSRLIEAVCFITVHDDYGMSDVDILQSIGDNSEFPISFFLQGSNSEFEWDDDLKINRRDATIEDYNVMMNRTE